MSLLAEHEVTRLIRLVDGDGASGWGSRTSREQICHELKRDVAPDEVLDRLERGRSAASRRDDAAARRAVIRAAGPSTRRAARAAPELPPDPGGEHEPEDRPHDVRRVPQRRRGTAASQLRARTSKARWKSSTETAERTRKSEERAPPRARPRGSRRARTAGSRSCSSRSRRRARAPSRAARRARPSPPRRAARAVASAPAARGDEERPRRERPRGAGRAAPRARPRPSSPRRARR